MLNKFNFLPFAAAAVVAVTGAGAANATSLVYSVGDVTSGSFGDAHIKKGSFTDTLAFTLADGGDFSASLTSAATRLRKSGDLDFTSVVLTGVGGPYTFTIKNNDGGDGLTDSAVFSGLLGAGSYLLTITGNSFGNAQFGGNTTLTTSDVPEAATWLSMLLGFGIIGAAARRRRTSLTFA
ncbi:MAG: PEP-CTERM sorting domain-containing protein [Sphingomonas sp.]|nr:PEP-CTERM sorting domain-containing protein [Sphingomonas sp.]